MLDAAEPLLFRGRDQFAVTNERSRRITMEAVETENDHGKIRKESIGAKSFSLAVLARGFTAKTTVDQLQRDQAFHQHPLESVKPAWPAVDQAALDHEHIEKDDNWRRPSHTAESIRGRKEALIRLEQIIDFEPGIALLRSEPARQRLAV